MWVAPNGLQCFTILEPNLKLYFVAPAGFEPATIAL